MAQRTIVEILDDLDGSADAQTYRFGWDGQEYEIDLGLENGKEFEEFIQPYLEHGRKVSDSPARPARRGAPRQQATHSHEAAHDIREWAIDHGFTISKRGRIPQDVLAAYEAAH